MSVKFSPTSIIPGFTQAEAVDKIVHSHFPEIDDNYTFVLGTQSRSRVCSCREHEYQTVGFDTTQQSITIDAKWFDVFDTGKYHFTAQIIHEHAGWYGRRTKNRIVSTGGRHNETINSILPKEFGLKFKSKKSDSHGYVHPVISEKFKAFVDALDINWEAFTTHRVAKPETQNVRVEKVSIGCDCHYIKVSPALADQIAEAGTLCGGCNKNWALEPSSAAE